MSLRRVVVCLLASVVCLGVGERAAYADLCLTDNTFIVPVQFQLQIGTASPLAGTPIVVTGVKTVLGRTSVMGTLRVDPGGSLVISLQLFPVFGIGGEDDSNGSFTNGTTIITFPTSGPPTFVTTFGGNPVNEPLQRTGALQITACP
jgi:hypothetical protein